MNDITEVDRLNATINEQAAKIADLKKTVEWLQGRTGITMGAAARAEIAAPSAQLLNHINEFPEINMGNYGEDEVSTLNNWGMELIDLARALPAPQAPDTPVVPTEPPYNDGPRLSIEKCIAQFRMYAEGPVAPVAKHQLNFCADFLRDVDVKAQRERIEEAIAILSAAHASVPAEPSAPHILEAISYHANERDDLTLEDAVKVLRFGWRTVSGRTERAMLLQIIDLLASAPTDTAAIPVDQPNQDEPK